jgi:hypothetical protein
MRRLGLSRCASSIAFFTICLFCSAPGVALGFDDQITHPQITRVSAERSSLGAVLKNDLSIAAGLLAELRARSGRSQSVVQWLRVGSQAEDDPGCRANNHFHNPLLPFPNSGLTDLLAAIRFMCRNTPFTEPRSIVLWGTRFVTPNDRGPATINSFDWDAARTAYLNALMLPSSSDREAALAQAFEALGHLVHVGTGLGCSRSCTQ